ncbi:IS5 family transposase [Erythrobacter aureus]|uniref:IS5 family transposase n=1 Tax=Erythrobacter aureus TaxID=2182384 RepID=UPI003A95967C
MWRDAPKGYGPHKTIYNRFIRWNKLGVSNRIFAALAEHTGEPDAIMIDVTHLKARRTAASLLKRGGSSPTYRAHQGRTEPQTPCRLRWAGRPIFLLLTEGQMSDYKGAPLLLPSLPRARVLLGDKGYDKDGFRAAFAERGITACVPPLRHRKVHYHYDKQLYRQRHKIENVFARIKDWRRVATRYDRCAHRLPVRRLYRHCRLLLVVTNES